VAEHVARLRFALEPVLARSEVEVRVVPGEPRAQVRYAVATTKGQREERVVYARHADGQWYLDPASATLLPLAGPAPRADGDEGGR
jgi:hypothetical protein